MFCNVWFKDEFEDIGWVELSMIVSLLEDKVELLNEVAFESVELDKSTIG